MPTVARGEQGGQATWWQRPPSRNLRVHTSDACGPATALCNVHSGPPLGYGGDEMREGVVGFGEGKITPRVVYDPEQNCNAVPLMWVQAGIPGRELPFLRHLLGSRCHRSVETTSAPGPHAPAKPASHHGLKRAQCFSTLAPAVPLTAMFDGHSWKQDLLPGHPLPEVSPDFTQIDVLSLSLEP